MIRNIGRNKHLIDVHPGRKAGRIRKVVYGSRETAQRIANSLYESHYRGLFKWPEQSTTTIAMLLANLMENRELNDSVSERDEVYSQLWSDLIGSKRADSITGTYLKSLAREWMTLPQKVGGRKHPMLLEAGTVNRRMGFLMRAFQLGIEADPPLVTKKPVWHQLKENPPKSGFVNWPDFERLRALQPDWLQVPSTIGHWSGMRLEEVLGLRREQVTFDHSEEEITVDLRPGETKNGEPRFIILGGDAYDIISRWEATTRQLYPTCEYLCHREGEKIGSIRYPWNRACVAAGLGEWRKPEAKLQSLKEYHGLTFHDLRRTGVRNLRRAGVDEKTIMLIIGHKTDAMFRRYNIIDEEDVREAGKKVSGYIRARYSSASSGGQSVASASPSGDASH